MRWVKVATEISSLVSMLFRTFLNSLKFLMEIFNILCIYSSQCVNRKEVHGECDIEMADCQYDAIGIVCVVTYVDEQVDAQ